MPLTRRQVYRRRRIVVFGSAAIVLAAGFYLPFTLLAPLPVSEPVVSTTDVALPGAPAIDFPPYGASGFGAVGYDGVLTSAGTTDPLPIASITKVITALVVLEAHPLEVGDAGPTATFTEIDEQFYADQVAQDGIVAPVAAGQTMSERNMLDLALMASANNYAQSVATWAFGSESAYVEAARDWLQRQGMTGTTITDATGIQPTNTSTVADLITLAKLAVANPVVAQIVASTAVEVPGIGIVENRNGLLGIDGVDGIKTGTLDESGACLLFSQDITVGSHSVTVVGVVLGGPDHNTINAAIRGMLGQADSGFVEVTLADATQTVAQYTTPWGDSARVVPVETVTAAVWAGGSVNSDVTVDEVHLVDDGDRVGALTFEVGEKTISVDLAVSGEIDDPGPWWRLSNPGLLF
jgi:D-alanyl-D-alanine carboxypeptidase (penicillin-binding protein 5/6)